jgi:uncharacterized linocin/CFP29 family protein
MDLTTTAPGTAPGPLTAHLTTAAHSGGSHASKSYTPPKGIHLGRERVKWTEEVWERIDRAVNYEFQRTRVAARFLPHHRVDPHTTTVPQDQILSTINGAQPFSLAAILAGPTPSTPPLANIDEAASTKLVEIWVEFSLTAQQVEQENQFKSVLHEQSDGHDHSSHQKHPDDHDHPGHHKHHSYSTAVTLATRAANILSQAQDAILFQGQAATGGPGPLGTQTPPPGPFFASEIVQNRGVPGDYGLLSVGPSAQNLNLPAAQVVAVPSFPPTPANFAVQTITISGATGGNFTLTLGANTTGAIAWSAANATLLTNIQGALTAAPVSIPPANVAVTAGSLNNGLGTILVTFAAAAIPATLMTANSAGLTAAAAGTATVSVGIPGARYVENTVGAITTAYSLLQAGGHYGPYAAVLYFYPYADSYAPLAFTLILPADRIRPLMTEGYFGAGTLPGVPNPVNPPAAGTLAAFNPTNLTTQSMGFVVSTGGNTMDLVIGQDPVTAFSQLDQNGNHLFRVLARFALRLKDPSAVIRLEFQ